MLLLLHGRRNIGRKEKKIVSGGVEEEKKFVYERAGCGLRLAATPSRSGGHVSFCRVIPPAESANGRVCVTSQLLYKVHHQAG